MNFAGPFDAKLQADSPVSLDGGAFSFGAKPGFVQHHPSDAHVVVPDAHLLFSGNYVRIGSDLIISNADQKFVVGNYFKGETRPALTSNDGATLSGQIVDALTGHVHYAQAGAPAAAQVIGHVLKMSGGATAIRNGVSVELHVGDAVQKGDVVQTGSDSSIGMTFVDGSAFGMTSNARMVLNEMIYDPNGSSNSSLISLVQGTITFVAGQTAKNGNMRVETPVATMGIRGTAVLVEIAANDGPTKFSVLLEPDGHTGSFNLYDKTTGQLIGTVSQAGQVTLVSSLGIGQPPTAIEQLKTLADQEASKALIQDVFKLFFPNYNPDNSNPKTQKFGFGSPGDNLSPFAFNPGSLPDFQPPKIIVIAGGGNDPNTGQPTPPRIFYNTKAVFFADKVTAEQSFVSSPDSFKIADVVHIDDPDVGNAPFYDVATPFVAGSAVIKSAVSTNPNLSASFLSQFLHIDQNTGVVSFDRLAFNFLGQGESVTFMLQVTSQSGPDSAQVIIPITITGDNDVPNGAPTIVVPVSDLVGTVKEDTHVTSDNAIVSNGTITFRDVDLSDTHVATIEFTSSSSTLPEFAAGAHRGTFTIDPVSENATDTINTGTVNWHFSLPDNDPVLQSLAEGQTITQVYTITIKDIHDAFVTQTITITITGTNDAPVLTSDASTHQTVEVPNTTGAPNSIVDVATGTLAFTDVDLSDTHTASAALHPGATSVVWSGGDYNDIPQATRDALNSAVTASVSESNIDTSNQGSVGWEFKLPDHLFDFLAKGQTLTLTYDVTVTDNNGVSSTQQVTVQIGAANDQPVISVIDNGAAVKEDVGAVSGILKDTGWVIFTDTDLTDTHTAHVAYNHDAAGSAGVSPALALALATALTVPTTALAAGDHDFDWNFALNTSLVQYLAEGETITATYTITVGDNSGETNGTSAGQVVTVTITGTNDAPTITSGVAAASATVAELTATTGSTALDSAGGTITFGDVDLTDTHQITQSNATFAWSGGTLTSTQINDLTNASARTLVPHDSTGTGSGSIDWTYKITDGALDFLALNQTLTVKYDITVADYHNGVATGTSTFQTVTVTYTGSNDAPVVSSTVSDALVVEDGPGSVLNALATASDVDNGTTLSVVNVPGVDATGSLPPGVSYDPGTHTFTLDPSNAAYQHLAEGVTTTVTVNYGVSDGIVTTPTPGSVSWTITGTNDAPAVSGAVSNTLVVEDGPSSALDALANASDVDDGTTLSVVNVPGVDAPGTLPPGVSYDPGTHTFTLDPSNAAYQSLADGVTTTVTVNYGVSDSILTTPASVSWTITGTNDAPAIVAGSTTATGAISKVTNTTGSSATDSVSGTIAFADPDSTGTHTATAGSPTFTWSGGVLTAAQIAALAAADSFVPSVSEAGGTGSVAWTYNITNSALDFMLPWETLTVRYNLTVADNYGLSVVQPVTVTISANNQSSPYPAGHADLVTLSANMPAFVPVLNNDTGNGIYIYETLAYPYSSFTITNHSSDGATLTSLGNAIFYDPTTSNSFLSLAYGQTATDHFAYGIVDGSGNVSWANVTVTLTGADHISLTTLADSIGNAHTTVVSADATTLNPLDSLTGSGSDTLLLNGSGTFDLADVAHFSGFQDIVVHGSNASLKIDSSDTAGLSYIMGSGSNLTLTTADASLDLSHTLVNGFAITGTNAGGTTFIVGDSGTASAITAGSGPLTIQVASDTGAGLTLTAPVAGATLIGGNGNDTLVSAQTNVTMTGGAGADNFKFNANFGNDTVTDFHAGQDAVYFQSSLFTDVADILAHAQATGVGGADTLITSHDGSSTLTLKGVTVAQLHASDFHLT